jgi:hypothetical protein
MAEPAARCGLSGGVLRSPAGVKIRDEGLVKNKAVYVALDLNPGDQLRNMP